MPADHTAPGLGPGDEVEVEIGPVAHGGHCVARHEGQVLFVRHTAPGEQVTARVTEIGPGGRFVRADAVAVLRASPDRVAPPCRHAGVCGGCDFQHLSLPAQRVLKAEVVAEQFDRIAGLRPDARVRALDGDEHGLRWRTRTQFAVDASGRAGLRRHRSHELVPMDDCPITVAAAGETGVLQRHWPDADSVEVIVPGSGDPVLVARPETEPAPMVSEPVAADWTDGAGTRRAFRHTYEVAATGFWQVHPAAPGTFVAAVLEALDPRPGERALDLYAGVGLFAAALADAVGPEGQVVAVEADRLACINAQVNLADWPHALVVPGRVDDLLGVPRPARRGPAARDRATRPRKARRSPLLPPTADLIVLDPPRTGAGGAVVAALAAMRPRAIAYVACDPSALARDTAALGRAGYALAGVTAYDAFPMTHHVECVALLTKSHPDRQWSISSVRLRTALTS